MSVCPQCASTYQLPARFCGQCGASLPDPGSVSEEDPWVGKVVDHRYRVLSRIGSGGMGLVYKVEHIQLGKVAAMKVLHADTARDSEAVRRFRTEAQAVSRLNHPNIVQTFDFGQSEGSLYLVMEYVRGDDLAAVVKRDGPLPFDRAAPLFVQICSALTEAHEAGVIHRDLKPENIVVVARREGSAHAKVLDFGLAKLRERADGAEITSGGQVIGTPYYMSPEQVRSEVLDIRTDIYSLGATLYRVLTGTPPFQATTPVGVLTKHITDPLEPPRVRAPELNLPPEADAIVARAMAKSREGRYPTAADVQRDLEAAIWSTRRATVSDTEADALERARLARRHRTTANAPTLAVRDASVRPTGDKDSAQSVTDSDGGGDERLRRQEFDAFEHSLRRRKIVWSVVLPLASLIVAGVGLWVFSRGHEKASSVEREPNNTPAQATLLPLDTPVQGKVGKRLGDRQPDMDYFRVPAGKMTRVISARLEGIPDVDLVLELFDAQGVAQAKSDSHGGGRGEWLQPTTVGPGEAFLLVRQVWIQGQTPVEDVADPYRLSVHWGLPQPGWEIEPNDSPAIATPLESLHLRGFLGSAEDRDWYSLPSVQPGKGSGKVSAPAGVDVEVFRDDNEKKVISKRGAGGDEEFTFAIEGGHPVRICVARKPAPYPTANHDPKDEPLPGLDDPYEITIDGVTRDGVTRAKTGP